MLDLPLNKRKIVAMDIEKLHQDFESYGKIAKQWQRKCSLLLPSIKKYGIWYKKGFNSIYEYAFALAGMSKWQVDNALWVINGVKDKPALLKVVEEKGVNAVRPVVTIATKETAEFWAKKATEMKKNDLEVYVRDVRRNEGISQEKLVKMNLKPEVAAKLEKLKSGDWNELMENFISLYEQSLEEEKPEKIETPSRHVPKAIKDYVLQRANGLCEFPWCKKSYDHLHHIDRFASKREHDPDRIVALCSSHHGLAHRGLIDEENWKIRKEPDYTHLNWYVDEKVLFHQRS